jgi:ADP-ribosylglycohydrolase
VFGQTDKVGSVTCVLQLDPSRFRGALLGLAVGDALGATLEFKRPGTFAPITDMVGQGPFDLPPGAYTDDTAMALCLAESLVEHGDFDPVDQLHRYVGWYRHGHNASTGECFDIGTATRVALERFERTTEPFPGDAAPDAAGNGPLMKLAPVPMAFAGRPDEAIARAADSARTTHGAPEALDAARAFAGLLLGALTGVPKDQLLEEDEPPVDLDTLHPKVAAVLRGSYKRKAPPEIRGGGYVVEALEAALWAVHGASSYEEAVLRAANLGDDADTTAAIAGQLAGALYGVEQIPRRWRERLYEHDRIAALADDLRALAEQLGSVDVASEVISGPLARPADPETPPGTYWALPNTVLAGPYPGATIDQAEHMLEELLDLGITCFVDLTEEREGPPLVPYAPVLRALARRRGEHVTHVRLPIRDIDVPSAWQMRSILDVVRMARGSGDKVYVHCQGGIGRTGTVIACLLVEEGEDVEVVLDRLSERGSPETERQKRFVREWRPLQMR